MIYLILHEEGLGTLSGACKKQLSNFLKDRPSGEMILPKISFIMSFLSVPNNSFKMEVQDKAGSDRF